MYPALDLQNKQNPSAIMLWVGGVQGRSTCYSGWDPAASSGDRNKAFAFILNATKSDLDDAQTRAVFGSSHNNPVGQRFTPVGDDILR